MHELAIAEELVNAVRQELVTHPGAQVRAVKVRVGALRLVQVESLRVCFLAAARDTRLAGSRLDVEAVRARGRCRECGAEFPIEEQWFTCPRCDAVDAEMLAGGELQLTGIELVEPAPGCCVGRAAR